MNAMQTDGGMIFAVLVILILLVGVFGIGANVILNRIKDRLDAQNKMIAFVVDRVKRIKGEKVTHPPIPSPERTFENDDTQAQYIGGLLKEVARESGLSPIEATPPAQKPQYKGRTYDGEIVDLPADLFNRKSLMITDGAGREIKRIEPEPNLNIETSGDRKPIKEILTEIYDKEEK